ncbi:MAG: transporter [Phenylobacterium sp.]|nr:transporter [Phenylobacterium sp.]
MTAKVAKEAVAKGAWYTLALLTLVYMFNSVDRSVMSIVIEPVKREFGLSDGQLGVLTGLAFGLTYALVGIPIGLLVDRTNRRNLLALMVFIWSGCTALCGVAQSYVGLVAARLAVGGAESAGTPTAMSMIADLFPQSRRSTPIAIFWTSTALGTATSLMLGAVVVVHYGWRAAFFIAGLPGLAVAALMLFTVREPVRERRVPAAEAGAAAEAAPSFFATLRYVFRTPAVFHAFAGTALNSIAMSGVPVWAASFLVRTQHFSLGQAGLVAGIGVGVFGGIGSLMGGPIGDYVTGRFGLRALPLVPFAASAIAMVAGVVFALSPQLPLLVAGFIVFEMASRAHTGPAYNLLLSGVEPRMRGVVVSSVQAATNLIGYGTGPLIVGVVSDMVGGEYSLRIGVATVMVFSLWASLHFLAAWWSTRRRGPSAATLAAEPRP